MINALEGYAQAYKEGQLILQVHGISFQVATAQAHFFKTDQKVTIYIYMHWNQEQGPSLYGFQSELEKTVFLLIISCSGVGPKLGLTILSALSPQDFLYAIARGDEKLLSSVSGVGAKKAEQLVVHLKHKVAKLLDKGLEEVTIDPALEQWKNISQVLQSLSYSKQEIDNTLSYLQKDAKQEQSFDVLMRTALSFLAKQR